MIRVWTETTCRYTFRGTKTRRTKNQLHNRWNWNNLESRT